ncbi:MAG: penicillin-binding protein 2 [Gammaproteobacteria bacterium]|nr:penicillin-binding protein 2 [Gammaproteobacteria bacterium]
MEPLALKDHDRESRAFFRRIMLGFSFVGLLLIVLVGRLFYLQIIQYEVFSTLSDKNRIQVQPLPPMRGLIYDKNGELLADNAPSFYLTVTPEAVSDLDGLLVKLDELLELEDSELKAFKKRLNRRKRPFSSVPLRYKLTQKEIARVSVDRMALPGVQVEARLVRRYPKGELMVHAIGSVRRINEDDIGSIDPIAYLGTDHLGKIGIEKYYEKDLLGKVGYQRVEIDARGRIMKVLDSNLPSPGKNIHLHIDSGLQLAAYKALRERRGAVVAIDPSTGGILAIVSKPSYDPNLFVTGIDHASYRKLRDSRDAPLFNRAVQGQYEPGSTIKPLLGISALTSGLIDEDYTIDDPGWYQLPQEERLYRDWNWKITGEGGHGEVGLEKAIYRSCNVFFYDVSVRLGIDQISKDLALFGLGLNTVLDFPEAKKGLLPSREWKERVRGIPWYPGDTLNIGIGQGDLLVTPLQLASAISVVANRGKWVAPRILNTGSELIEKSKVSSIEDFDHVSKRHWDFIISAMEKVVHRNGEGLGENGTAWASIGQYVDYRMAGKSGTAQVVGIAQGEEYIEEEVDERLRKHAWFVGFAPINNPTIALAVIVENGGSGSEIAGPVARSIIDYHLKQNSYKVAKLSNRDLNL